MDPRHTDAEDEQFLLNMIAEGQGDDPEQADDLYLNTDVLNKVLMYISQLYLFVLKIIFSFESI